MGTMLLLESAVVDSRNRADKASLTLARRRGKTVGHDECAEVSMAVGIKTTARQQATVERETAFMRSRAAESVPMSERQ